MFRARLFRDDEHLRTFYFSEFAPRGCPPDSLINLSFVTARGEPMTLQRFFTFLEERPERVFRPHVDDVVYASNMFFRWDGEHWLLLPPTIHTSALYSKALRAEDAAPNQET